MLIYSMSVSVDGFIADREGACGWTAPSEAQARFHIAQARELGGHLCGRRLYATMRRARQTRRGAPAAGHRTRRAGADRDQDVRLARDLRALRARPRCVGLNAARPLPVRRLLRQSTGALTSRAAFPLTAPAFAIAWERNCYYQ